MSTVNPKFEFLCRMGDNALVLGHRVSEWCGLAPVLEEDIALANVALDLIPNSTRSRSTNRAACSRMRWQNSHRR